MNQQQKQIGELIAKHAGRRVGFPNSYIPDVNNFVEALADLFQAEADKECECHNHDQCVEDCLCQWFNKTEFVATANGREVPV